MQLLKRQSRVRVEQWLRKLAEKARLRALTGPFIPAIAASSLPRGRTRCLRLEHSSAALSLASLSKSVSPAALLKPLLLRRVRAQTTNPVWKRNRNLHARLLLEQLRAGRLAEPFERPPPDGPLRTLGAWAAAPYLSRCRCARVRASASACWLKRAHAWALSSAPLPCRFAVAQPSRCALACFDAEHQLLQGRKRPERGSAGLA